MRAPLILPGNDGIDGPDLAVLRLPPVAADTLSATNSFYPLDRSLPPMAGNYRNLGAIDSLLGVVGEWTTDIELTAERRRKQFTLLYCGGLPDVEPRAHNGFDLLAFTPTFEPDKTPPSSYAGMSGGDLWRAFFLPDGSNRIVHRRLIGVAFYENPTPEGMRLSCHGPQSLTDQLLPAMRRAWPDAAPAPTAARPEQPEE